MKRIGVFTSGGDSPGMNACLRAVVRTANWHKVSITGIYRGYEGMIDGDFKQLEPKSVSNIIHLGGTILKTARSKRFMTVEGRKQAYENLQQAGIEGLIAIGGDGTFAGASVFQQEFGIPIIGIPGTIDNDLAGTDYTLGFDTAINTAMQAIDKIRDTANSHNRLFLVEVMGRDAGCIALFSGIAAGAEAILIPESVTDEEKLLQLLEKGWNRQKSSCIVVIAEGDEAGGAFAVGKKIQERFPNYDTRITVLGHIQRGGSPTCQDRVLAARLGAQAVEALLSGKSGQMVGIINQQICFTPFAQAVKQQQEINPQLIKLVEILSA
ncbi:MAG: 6-phosphofructokinase [Bacteroidia bacterium]|nr:6-phosphofructokinase [Bacteroidia bacterium]